MKIIDLFCGAGGAAMGLHRAFPDAEIVGVDINPQPRFPFEFVQDNALTFPLGGYDFFWASPPCQAHSRLRGIDGRYYMDFIQPIRMRFDAEVSSKPTVIENVVGASLINPIMLCGSMFPGLGVWRHRIFEVNFPVRQPKCRHNRVPLPIDVTGTGGPCLTRTTPGGGIHRKPKNMAQAKEVMGIDWMIRREITQAIPPAYSEYIGKEYNKTLELTPKNRRNSA
jgi:DNA (cytosine-5)-methyltransferase 1